MLSSGLHVALIAQPGLEGIEIETYYIADSNDVSTLNFPVPADAVTYRVFVDMNADWELQAIFGSTNTSTGETDSLIIRSTEPFFNNEDRGKTFGYLISTNNIDENTVLLDSWFSTGRPSTTTEGVVKPEDTNGGTPGFPNLDGLLQNDDPLAGIPISITDGNMLGSASSTWTLIGITPTDLAAFNNINLAGNELFVLDGAFTSFSIPLHGPNGSNRVLIGQFTTAGDFSGQLNLQIKNSVTGEIQQWVAETPGSGQFTSPSLTWEENVFPEVTITTPINNTLFLSGELVNVIANATDQNGIISQVEFLFDGISVNIDDTAPYEASFLSTSSGMITAIATDDNGAQTSSNPVFIEVNPYKLTSIEQLCTMPTVCIPIEIFGEGIEDVNGLDIVITFDNTKIIPTGNIFKSSDMIDLNYFNILHTIDVVNQQMLIAVFLNGNASLGTSFTGIGELLCIEFSKRPAFAAEDSTMVSMTSLQETFLSGGIVQRDSVSTAVFSTIRNTTFFGSLAFWAGNAPIIYDFENPADHLITNIKGSNENCDSTLSPSIQPDLDGAFTHDLKDGVYLSIDRDIDGATDVQAVINSFDAFLIRKLLVDEPSFVPTVYQMMAMDVNRDGVISAGDVSQINRRSLLITDEFRQAWNYNGDGTPKQDYKRSKDWQFVSQNTILTDPAYSRSATFPFDNGIGFSKSRVPQVPFCIWTERDNLPFFCPELGVETYYGILIGDVNGNYRFQ